MKRTAGIIFLVLFSLFSSSTYAFQQEELVYSVFLIGDAGEPIENPVLTVLRQELDKVGEKGAVIFLGDNIYPNGLPPIGHKDRAEAENVINKQIDAVRGFGGRTVFIPGNHDWAQGKDYGLQWLRTQEDYVETALDGIDAWLPTDGCPGPVEVELTDQITLIVLDTQWFLQRGDKPSVGCEAGTITDVAELFQDMLRRNEHKKVIVANHHPMYSYGPHGGVFTVKDHLFPLTASPSLRKAYVPLPGLGSVYVLYRKWFGSIQDIPHPEYKRLRNGFVELMSIHPDLVHVAGHEHALEHIERKGMHFVVSGSGSKNNTVTKKKGDARFVSNATGFARLDYYSSGRTDLTFITNQGDVGEEIYTDTISDEPFKSVDERSVELLADISFAGQSTEAVASNKYIGKSKLYTFIFGENYRKEWATNLTFPVFDIGTIKGGLKIIKKGGGHQTISLRLEAEDGKQYVIRSIDKNPELALPSEFRRTFIKKIVQDGISSSHPYAPLVIPPLADAVGIYHANPKVYYIPDDPRFGIYRQEFANKLVLFEERANREHVEEPFFGSGEDAVSSLDLYKILRKDNDNRVDQTFVVRNRIFDIWIGDWDRHDDQWRWVEENRKDDEKIYRPIPRDRDQVFFGDDGFFKKIVSFKWAQPALRGFQDDLKYTPSMGHNRVRWFDRYFMTEASKEDWIEQANELKAVLTDDLIESSVRLWPDEIYDLHGEEIIRKLKNRRDRLDHYAEDYYRFLAKGVDILGSDKREWFFVERVDDDHTKVTVRKISNKGNVDKVLYERTFKTSETGEVRLFGFNGDDKFDVVGRVEKGITVRIIAGDGNDDISDKSEVRGIRRKTVIYDTIDGSELSKSRETKDLRTNNDPYINDYNLEEFDFDIRRPVLSFNFNPDDGVFIGGGVATQKDGFRKRPYASFQSISASTAIATGSYNIAYRGEFVDAIGSTDFVLNASVRAPNFVNNFFGFGNETIRDRDLSLSFYRVRFDEWSVNPSFNIPLGNVTKLTVGSEYRAIKIERNEGRFINDFAINGLDPSNLFTSKKYIGAHIGLNVDTRKNLLLGKKGITLNTSLSYNLGANGNSNNSGQWNSDLTLRWAIGPFSRVVIATRVGFQTSLGDFEFFQASRLDGFNTLRGFRRYRFAGESSFYQQLDARIDLFEWRNYLIPSRVGLLLFNDVGRVWIDGENSDTLHHGYGGGAYLIPFESFVINLLLARSVEGSQVLVKFGFFF